MPAEHRQALAKTEIALTEIDRIMTAGMPKVQNVDPPAVQLHWPKASTGWPRNHPVPNKDPVPAEQALQHVEWHRIAWRQGTKGPLMAGFAAMRARPAEGEQLRQGRHLPGEEVWLIGEHRSAGERKYYLANLPQEATLEELAATIKARWICEQVHQQMKEELSLDHFEGRSP
ncbi:hypothetical protein [Geminicoccus sp.]|jgi:SRSO17 transposase|uniref:hypothetical protein n=1 Tax=Geminicoccus sp. TaxID=2024832 RepID=UPI0039C87F27